MPQKRDKRSDFSMGLKERLKDLRKSFNMTQIQFGEFVGISSSSIGLYETGERIPDAEILYKIAKQCNISVDYLLGISNVKSTDTEVKTICEYTGLNESAVNRLHWDKRFYVRNNELISMLIAPDGNSKMMNDLLYITGALHRYGDGYFKLIDKMSSLCDTIKDFPTEKFREESNKVSEEEKLNKYDYLDVINMFKELIDDYIGTHIKTPENEAVYKKYKQAVNDRKEDEQ